MDGRNGDHGLLAPPFTASEAGLAIMVDRMVSSITAAIASL